MDRTDVEALRVRLETLVRENWGPSDKELQVLSILRTDNKIDMRIISPLFEGKDGLEREAFFYPVFAPIPKTEMLHMTYCLLLTPEEAVRVFAIPMQRAGEDNTDDWA